MKRFLLLLIVSALLVGCVGGGGTIGRKTINLVWKVVPQNISPMAEGGEAIVVGQRYSYMPTEMDINVIEVAADVNGKTSGEFEFRLASDNPFKQVANNRIVIEPEQAEQGTIMVKAEDVEEVFDYVIFPAAVIKAWGNPEGASAFSFEQGKYVAFDESDVWFAVPPEEEPYNLKANVCIVDLQEQDFWTDFIKANNLHEYEYEVRAFKPEFDKLYYVKTKNNGYAVLRLTAHSGWNYNVMYKYSETGVFEQYDFDRL